MFSFKITNFSKETSLSFSQSMNVITNLIKFLKFIFNQNNEEMKFIFVELIVIILEILFNLKRFQILHSENNTFLIELILEFKCSFVEYFSDDININLKIRFYSILLSWSLSENLIEYEQKEILLEMMIPVNIIIRL